VTARDKIPRATTSEPVLLQRIQGTQTDMRIAARFETPFDSRGAGWEQKQVNAFKEREKWKGDETEEAGRCKEIKHSYIFFLT